MHLFRTHEHMNTWIGFWNPMAASSTARWSSVLLQFVTLHVFALAGTKQCVPNYLPDFVSVFKEHIGKFNIYHWPCSETQFSNSSTGVSIGLRFHPDDHTRHQVFSPPPELQGRAGAVARHNWDYTSLHLCFYLPVSGPDTFKSQCDRKLFDWAQEVIASLPKRINIFVYADANARVGWLHFDGRYFRQDVAVVGPLANDIANVIGVELVRFLRRNQLALVNTFIGGHCTFYSWHGTASRPDYLACPQCKLASVVNCCTWKATAFQLQLTRVPQLRDHVPLVCDIVLDYSRLSSARPRPWDRSKLDFPLAFPGLSECCLR